MDICLSGSPTKEKELLEEYRRSGSDEAFARIVARHIHLVFSVCLRETGDRQTAEDLTQAVFLLLARKASGLSRETALPGWLFSAARLVSRNAVRDERRRRDREEKAARMRSDQETASRDEVDARLNDPLIARVRAQRRTPATQ